MLRVLESIVGRAAAEPNRPALLDEAGAMTYGELTAAVRRTAAWAQSLPATVGLLAPKDRQAVIWHLALAWAGRTVVPLPDFFAPAQLAHMAADADIAAVVAAPAVADLARGLGRPVLQPAEAEPDHNGPTGGARWIIYTSGTTGRPKGVVIGEAQIDASVTALALAAAAGPTDRMLSVLPFALLLEQVAGIALPLALGAAVALCPDPRGLAAAAERFAPTATILVPELLAAWVAGLEGAGRQAPASLRFVAVGGAPVPSALAERAWAVGLPVYEGYGLSECCSVVALNRPNERQGGTVGRPLPGVEVTIEDGEIVVTGTTVMAGYLGGGPAGGRHRTGDLGHFDAAGRLVVEGRRDEMIVTTTGRNIQPEWIETMILADRRIARCAVVDGGSYPRAVLVAADPRLAEADAGTIDALVARLTAAAPEYARPQANRLVSEAMLHRQHWITANGRLQRRAIAAYYKEFP